MIEKKQLHTYEEARIIKMKSVFLLNLQIIWETCNQDEKTPTAHDICINRDYKSTFLDSPLNIYIYIFFW